ncbi:MAG: dTDP-4-dehydrorhamnose reductase [Sphingomicrobium sp.]
MKLLVVGHRGQVARALAERARGKAGLELTALGRPGLDLATPGSAAAAITGSDADVVINAAAFTAVDSAEDEPALADRINGEAAGEVAAAALGIGAPVIQISTDYVFDGRSRRPYRPGDPPHPLGAYGRSKLAGEEAVRASNPGHFILRTAWVISPFGPNFVTTMLRLAGEREEIAVVDDQIGSPTSALEFADGVLAAAQAASAGVGLGRTYHLAGAGQCSWAELAAEAFDISRKHGGPWATVRPIPSSDYPVRAERPAYSVLDNHAFEAEFGVTMPPWQRSLEPIVARLLAS